MNNILNCKKLHPWIDRIYVLFFLLLVAGYAHSQQLIEAQKNLYQHEKSLKAVDNDRFIIVAHRGAVVNDTLLENSIESY